VYRTLKVIILSAAFIFILLGCQNSVMADKTLEGTMWTLNYLASEKTALPEAPVTLQFEGDAVAGSGGCNQYRAQVTFSGPSSLSVGPIGRTKKLCPGPMMEQEDEYLRKLESVTSYELNSGELVLIYDEGSGEDFLVFGP
jgi:heat shock protein HslJ